MTNNKQSASMRLSVRMQDIAQSLDDILAEVCGERVSFVLVVQADKTAQYISNTARKESTDLLLSLFERWKANRADIPAHMNPDLKT